MTIYFHKSAMETKLMSGIFLLVVHLVGLPFLFVDVVLLITDKVSIVPFDNPRITAICCAHSGQPKLFVGSVCMPWNDRSINQTISTIHLNFVGIGLI